MGEVAISALLCLLLNGGVAENRYEFNNLGEPRHGRTDCEAGDYVMEMTLDGKPSGRDSIVQALLPIALEEKATGAPSPRKPMVIVIDTDGVEDRYQMELRVTADYLGIPYVVCSRDFILRWAATSRWRAGRLNPGGHDLPRGTAATFCDLGKHFGTPLLN